MEVTVCAKTVEEAVRLGAEQLGKDVNEVQYTVIEEAKKGLFGLGATDAKVSVSYKNPVTAEGLALGFVNNLISDMGVCAVAKISKIDERFSEKGNVEKDVYIDIQGENCGVLIGRHGDVLDSVQYLANLAAARAPKTEDNRVYLRVIVDVEGYRAKREETLRALARKMASKALSYRKNLNLEPMTSYERRIIHSEIQNIDGVHTYSVGADSERRVIIAYGDEE